MYIETQILAWKQVAPILAWKQVAPAQKRRQEISEAVGDSGFKGPRVGIVPVQTTESWLLLDETEIREIAGRPTGVVSLDLPTWNRIEYISDPKYALHQALIVASETAGKRRRNFMRDIPILRQQLLDNLPIGGPLEQVPSWVRFRDDLQEALDFITSKH